MTEFFPPLDLNDTFGAPWATPKDLPGMLKLWVWELWFLFRAV